MDNTCKKIHWRLMLLIMLCSFSTLSSITVSLPDTLYMPNTTFTIPITTTSVSGLGVYSVLTRIEYDPNVLAFQSINRTGCITSSWASTSNVQNNMLLISMFGTTPLSGFGKIVNIVFQAIGDVHSSTDLHFDNFQYNEGTPSVVTSDGYIFVGPPEPWFDPLPNLVFNEGNLINFTITAHDPLGRPLSLSAPLVPTGSTFAQTGNGVGVFNWQTSMQNAGLFPVAFYTQNTIGVSNTINGVITINEIHSPPHDVSALTNGNNINVSWEFSNQYGLTPNGFKVWRLVSGQETNENTWTLLTDMPTVNQFYIDTQWGNLVNGSYKWAVKTVYADSEISVSAISNPINKDIRIMSGTVTNNLGSSVVGANIVVGQYSTTSDPSGFYSILLPSGTYDVNASAQDYLDFSQNSVIIPFGQNLVFNFVMLYQTYSVMGRVVENGNISIGVSGATISMTGISPYTTASDTDGYFNFTSVICNHTYQIHAVKAGYVEFVNSVSVAYSNVNVGNIALVDIISPPTNAQALISGNNVSITWNSVMAQDRAFVGYHVWRFLSINQGNENIWTSLTDDPILDTSYIDSSWSGLPVGEYKWAVKAGYTGNVLSQAAISNVLTRPVTVVGRIVESGDNSIGVYNAAISLIGIANYNAASDVNGYFSIPAVLPNSTYQCSITKNGYDNYTGVLVIVASDIDYGNVILTEHLLPPANVTAVLINDETFSNITWSAPVTITREFMGFMVWRLLSQNETNESLWVLLTDEPLAVTSYTDINWDTLDEGTYKWAVRSIYTGNFSSQPAFSNEIEKTLVEIEDDYVHGINIPSLKVYPNPFNPTTTVEFYTKDSGRISLSVYNAKGSLVALLKSDFVSAGRNIVVWNGLDSNNLPVASGTYLVRLVTSEGSILTKVSLLK